MDFFTEALQRAQEQREAADRLIAAGQRPCAFPRRGGFAVIHRAAYGPAAWRITLLDEQREPLSHVDADTFADAVRWARFGGAELTQEVKP